MNLSPEERAALEQRVSEEEHHIQQKEHRLATGVGPKQAVEIEKDTAAWVLYVLAGIVTVAMPAAPWFYLRELRDLLEPSKT